MQTKIFLFSSHICWRSLWKLSLGSSYNSGIVITFISILSLNKNTYLWPTSKSILESKLFATTI